MARALRVLIVEDSPQDAELVLHELRRGGYQSEHRRVDTAEAMRAALGERDWDLVISDFSMPRFDVPAALRVLEESARDVPFIVISGTVGEETAVEALKQGAHDFMAKGNLARLLPAIERELRERDARRARREAEEAMRASERRLRAVMETATDAIVTFDGEGRVAYANAAAERTFGRGAGEFSGLAFTELFSPRSPPEALVRLAALLSERSEQGVVRALELVGRRRDGGEFPVELSCARWRSGGDAGATAIVRDATDRKQIEAQLLISERLASIGTLTAGVAHEINNPLAALLANLELAESEFEALGRWLGGASRMRQLRELLDGAREAGDRVRRIVRDLRIFSRAEEESRGPVDVGQLLDSTARLAWNEVRHRARLTREYGDVPPVDGNEFRLGQVFLNLIVNAAQAIPEGRSSEHEIVLATRLAGDGQVEVEVRDSGIGMTPEVQARLFTPFFTTKPRGIGTGLGLSICRRIVEGLRGTIEASSTPGRGSSFRVRLPQARLAPAPPAAPAAEPQAATRRGRVLVIDDEQAILNVVSAALAREHDVVALADAPAALERIARGERFDVVLCDMMMPRMNGAEFHAALQQRAPELATGTIFLTGGAFTPSARSFLEHVPNLRLEKPFAVADLRAIVRRQLA